MGQASPLIEPLRDDREAWNVDETAAHADKNALRQEELPDLSGERRCDESARETDDAGCKGIFYVEVTACLGGNGRHKHSHGEVETTNEGVVKGRSARKDIIVDVIGQEDTKGLGLVTL